MKTHNGTLTRTGMRLSLALAVLIATAGLMLAGGATGAKADGATNGFFGFALTSSSVVEGQLTSLTVNRTGGTAGTVNLGYTITPGPSPAGTQADISNTINVNQTLTFAPNQTSAVITVSTIDNATPQGSRNFTFTLNTADGGGVLTGGTSASHVLTITDNDGAPTYSYGAATYSFGEAAGLVNVPVVRNGSTAATASVTCTVTGGSATTGTDFTLTTSVANFAIGQTTANCQITIVNDTLQEPDETITMGFSGATGFTGGAGANPTTTVTIIDDDGTGVIQFSQPTYSVNESVGTATIAVTRTNGSTGAASILCSSTGGSATAGTDYTTITNQLLSWTAGDSTPKNCTVAITNDATPETTESFTLTLSGVTGATAGAQTTATVSILDDDSNDVLAFSAVSYSSNENATAMITVTRTGSLAGTVGVNYSTSNGTAIAGADYTTASGTLTFGAGVASQSFFVSVLNDSLTEPTETVGLSLFTPTGGASIGSPSTATLNILDGATTLPVVTALSPASGPINGGNLVSITGTNLSGTSQVAFGSAIAFPTSVSATLVTVVAPTSSTFSAQTVEVVVTTPAGPSSAVGTANDYTYTNGPTVTAVSPATGPASGLTFVTITGTGFTPTGMTVTFGGTTAVFTYVSATSISAVSPAHVAGLVDVIVTVASVPSPNTVADDFTYTGTSVPTVTGVSPTSGPVGTTVTVTGTGFTGATSVTVGGVSAAFTVVSDSSITVTIPAGTPSGLVSIRITTPSGMSLEVAANNFTNTSSSGATTTYTLYFRWSLIAWTGIDNISAANAVKGIETGTANPATNDVSGSVTAIWYFDGPSQVFKGYFVGFDNTPGANDFTTLRRGTSYWIAISTSGSVTWTVLQGP